jgi:hypothetical protein
MPFHREFLRVGLGSAAASWMVRWVEEAHAAISQGSAPLDGTPIPVFVAVSTPGPGVLAGVVRRSSDGLRRYPVALFVEDGIGSPAERHLWPLALIDVWEGLCALLDSPCASPDDFARTLEAGIPAPDLERAAELYREAMAAPRPGGAWEDLTGATGDAARHFARNLLSVGVAQREARSAEEGVGLRVPLPDPDRHAQALHAAVWLELVGATSGAPWATVGLSAAPSALYAFYRPTDGRDLATMLGGPSDSLDDLAEPWQAMPPGEPALAAALADVGTARPGPLAEVRAWVRSVVSA